MWNHPTEDELDAIPTLFSTEHVPLGDKQIMMHFYIDFCHWYVTEYDGNDTFFGLVMLNNRWDQAEWGYFSLREIEKVCIGGVEVTRDLDWSPKPLSDVFPEGYRL